jgi:xanthine dehydrogenase YagR molybdenum-binding subunit
LTGIRHEKLSITSQFDDWAEPATGVSSQLYETPNYLGVHNLIRGHTMTPTFMRGPGETLGVFVLETALDELAYRLDIDPVELRLRNHGPNDARGNRGRVMGWRSAWSAEPISSGGAIATRPPADAGKVLG